MYMPLWIDAHASINRLGLYEEMHILFAAQSCLLVKIDPQTFRIRKTSFETSNRPYRSFVRSVPFVVRSMGPSKISPRSNPLNLSDKRPHLRFSNSLFLLQKFSPPSVAPWNHLPLIRACTNGQGPPTYAQQPLIHDLCCSFFRYMHYFYFF